MTNINYVYLIRDDRAGIILYKVAYKTGTTRIYRGYVPAKVCKYVKEHRKPWNDAALEMQGVTMIVG